MRNFVTPIWPLPHRGLLQTHTHTLIMQTPRNERVRLPLRMVILIMFMTTLAARCVQGSICCTVCSCHLRGTVVCKGPMMALPDDCDPETYELDLQLAMVFSSLTNTTLAGLPQLRKLTMPPRVSLSYDVLAPLMQLQTLTFKSPPVTMPLLSLASELKTLNILTESSFRLATNERLQPGSLQSSSLQNM